MEFDDDDRVLMPSKLKMPDWFFICFSFCCLCVVMLGIFIIINCISIYTQTSSVTTSPCFPSCSISIHPHS